MFSFAPVLFSTVNVYIAYSSDAKSRQEWVTVDIARRLGERSNTLLKEMLPQQVLLAFQSENLKLAYRHTSVVCSCHADICGFTSWAKTVPATKVVELLSVLFSGFDLETGSIHSVFKVCTIGDAYVAISQPSDELSPSDVQPGSPFSKSSSGCSGKRSPSNRYNCTQAEELQTESFNTLEQNQASTLTYKALALQGPGCMLSPSYFTEQEADHSSHHSRINPQYDPQSTHLTKQTNTLQSEKSSVLQRSTLYPAEENSRLGRREVEPSDGVSRPQTSRSLFPDLNNRDTRCDFSSGGSNAGYDIKRSPSRTQSNSRACSGSSLSTDNSKSTWHQNSLREQRDRETTKRFLGWDRSRVVSPFLHMIHFIHWMCHHLAQTRISQNIPTLSMRIGVHVGTCIGTVIGSGRLRYGLLGPDVLTTANIEKYGIPEKICISQAVALLVKKSPDLKRRFSLTKLARFSAFHRSLEVYMLTDSNPPVFLNTACSEQPGAFDSFQALKVPDLNSYVSPRLPSEAAPVTPFGSSEHGGSARDAL